MPELTLEVLLASLSPFKYLGRETRRALAGELREQRFEPDEVIIERGSSGKAVYLLAEGSVAVVEPASGTTPPRVRGAFEGPTYFGERAALFEDPRRACLRAAGPCRCYSLPGERFLSLIAESTPFAQALARNLREKQGIFTPLEDFLAVLVENATRGVLDLETLLERYHALRPALHGDLDKSTLDIGAWSYALARLPANITETYVLLLSRSIPDALHPPDAIAEPVPTAARRRSAWSLRRGKDLVLLREGRTDLVDFVTNLLAHATEARKLRRRRKRQAGGKVIGGAQSAREHEVRPERLRSLPGRRGRWRHGMVHVRRCMALCIWQGRQGTAQAGPAARSRGCSQRGWRSASARGGTCSRATTLALSP